MDEQDTAQALKDLKAHLRIGGRLKIITAVPARASGLPPTDPAAWVQHDVVALEELDGGLWVATSAEGDATVGQPPALLRRLRRWRQSAAE